MLLAREHFQVAVDDNPAVPMWRARVLDQFGEVHALGPWDHNPSDDEILAQLGPPPRPLALTSVSPRDAIEPVLIQQAQEAMALAWLAEQRAGLVTSGAVKVVAEGAAIEGASPPTVADRAAEMLAAAMALADAWEGAG